MKPYKNPIDDAPVLRLNAPAPATVIDFEDLHLGWGTDPLDSYAGLNWDNFWGIDGDFYQGTGYDTGTVSGHQAVFNASGMDAAISSYSDFDLGSAYMTAAGSPTMTVTATAYDDGVLVATKSVTIDDQTPQLVVFNFASVDHVTFQSDQGAQFVLDDIDLALVPVTTGDIAGTVFADANRNGTMDLGETTFVGTTVYLDDNDNGILDQGERSTVTLFNGSYGFAGVTAGDAIVRVEPPSGTWENWQADAVHATVAAGDTAEADVAVLGGASTSADDIFGSGSADMIDALGGDDRVRGRGGSDIISGGAGDDALSGGGGDDFLFGGDGFDRLRGGAGADTFIVGAGQPVGKDVILDFDGREDSLFINAPGVNSVHDLTMAFHGTTLSITWEGAGGTVLLRDVASDTFDLSAIIFLV